MKAVHLDGHEDKKEVTARLGNDMDISSGVRNQHNLHGG